MSLFSSQSWVFSSAKHFPTHVLFAIACSFMHLNMVLNSKKRTVVLPGEIGNIMGHVRLLVQNVKFPSTHTSTTGTQPIGDILDLMTKYST